MGWNVLCSGASLAVAISHDCDKPACHCSVTISKQKGNNVILSRLHTSRPILKSESELLKLKLLCHQQTFGHSPYTYLQKAEKKVTHCRIN